MYRRSIVEVRYRSLEKLVKIKLNNNKFNTMAKEKVNGLMINSRMKSSGVTFYSRGGKLIARTATSDQPIRRTRSQFAARQQLAHSCRLWSTLKWAGEPMFPAAPSAYARFRTLMRKTPVVFLPQHGNLANATLLLPGIPVSDGVLPTVEQQLGSVADAAALLTNLRRKDVRRDDTLVLFTFEQSDTNGMPMVTASRREVSVKELTDTANGLALVGEEFDNQMKGWALVHVHGDTCSSQTVVTRCELYKVFATDEALATAAESYGGLTE